MRSLPVPSREVFLVQLYLIPMLHAGPSVFDKLWLCCLKNQKMYQGVVLPFLDESLTIGPETRSLQPVSGVSEQTRWVDPAPSHDRSVPSCASLVLRATWRAGTCISPGVSGLNFAPLPALPQGYLTFLDSTTLWVPKECQMPIGWSSRKENHTRGVWYCVEKSTNVLDSEWPKFNPSTIPFCFVMLCNLKSLLKKIKVNKINNIHYKIFRTLLVNFLKWPLKITDYVLWTVFGVGSNIPTASYL